MIDLKAHLRKIKDIENTMMDDIRGFNSLNKEQQDLLRELSAMLSNWFGDYDDVSVNQRSREMLESL